MNTKTNSTIKKTQNIIFPDSSSDTIKEIIKKYKLESELEPEKALLQWIESGKKSKRSKIAKIVAKVGRKKIPLENFATELEKELSIPLETAKKIAEELHKKILVFARKTTIELTKLRSKKATTTIKPAPKFKKEEPAEKITFPSTRGKKLIHDKLEQKKIEPEKPEKPSDAKAITNKKREATSSDTYKEEIEQN